MELTEPLRWKATESTEAPAVPEVAALVRGYSALLFRVANAVVRNRAEAEDVVQDTFVRVLQAGPAKLAAVRDWQVWLVRIAWNLALDRRRRRRPDQMDEQFAASLVARDLPADRAVAETRQMATVLAAIERLPAKEREVLLLSAMEELSTAAIAEVVGRSESATRALLFRARTRLKERLGEGGRG